MLRLIKRIILYLIFSNSILAYFARRVFWGRRIFKKLSTPETNFLLNLNFLGKVVYDIGSFTGGFTQFAAASVGKKGYVVAFEPNPKTYQVIKENIGRGIDSNVKVINTGVGLKNGTCRLYVRNVGAGTGSIDPNIQHQIVSEGDFYELDAPICSLDSFVLDQDQPPKFINIVGSIRKTL